MEMQEPGRLSRRTIVWHEVGQQPNYSDWTVCSVRGSVSPWPVGCPLGPRLGLICLLSLSGLCLIQAKLSEIQETWAIR